MRNDRRKFYDDEFYESGLVEEKRFSRTIDVVQIRLLMKKV